MTAESNAAASAPTGTTTPSVTANWDPGSGLYLDGSGNYYDQSGNPVQLSGGSFASQTTAPTAPAPTATDTYTPSTALGTGGGGGSTRYGV